MKEKEWRCSDSSLWGVETGSVDPAPVVREGEGVDVQEFKPVGGGPCVKTGSLRGVQTLRESENMTRGTSNTCIRTRSASMLSA